MTWDVEYTDEFGDWWASLTEDEQVSLAASVQLLEVRGAVIGASAQQRHQWLQARPYARASNAAWRATISHAVRI